MNGVEWTPEQNDLFRKLWKDGKSVAEIAYQLDRSIVSVASRRVFLDLPSRGSAFRLSVPRSGHPLVRKLFAQMRTEMLSVDEMAHRSGVHRTTIRNWRQKSNPRLADLDACFGVLGMKLAAEEDA